MVLHAKCTCFLREDRKADPECPVHGLPSIKLKLVERMRLHPPPSPLLPLQTSGFAAWFVQYFTLADAKLMKDYEDALGAIAVEQFVLSALIEAGLLQKS